MSGNNFKQREVQQPLAAYSQTVPKNQQLIAQKNQGTANPNALGPHEFENNYARSNINQDNYALIQRVSDLEEQLKQSTFANRNLYEELKKSEGELIKARQAAQRNGDTSNIKNAQVGELNNRYHEIAQGHNQFLDNARSHAFTVQRELEYKDEEINRLKGLLEEKSDKLKVVTVSQEKNFDRCIGLDREVATLMEENKELREELRRKSHQLDMEHLSHKAEGTFMVEVEHLRADVQRLLLMLKNTDEYKEFSDISDDAAHSIRFLKDIKARTYVDNKCNKNCRLIRPCQCPSTGENQWVEDEKLLWVPEEAFKFAHEFRVKYNGELTDTLIEKLLFELNKIWSKREQRLVKRVKGNAAHETAGLRRQLAFNPTYDEHQAKATIERLQRELRQAYKENREAFGQRERRNPVGTSYVNETLRVNKDGAKKKKEFESKNNLLKSKIQSMELNKYGSLSEKSVFMEGATWMSNQIAKEFDGLQKAISTHSTQLQSQQDSSHSHSQSFGPVDALRKCNWLIENVDTELGNFKNKLRQISNNTEKNMIDATLASKQIARPQSAIIDTF